MKLKTKPIPISTLDPARFWAKTRHTPLGCILWTGDARSGKRSKDLPYGRFYIGARNRFSAHRVAYELYHGEGSADGMMVCHTCDRTLCLAKEHLFLGTHRDNMADMVHKGRARSRPNRGAVSGSGRPRGKMGRAAGRVTLAEAGEIRAKYHQQHMTHAAIALEHDLSSCYIGQICRGRVLGK